MERFAVGRERACLGPLSCSSGHVSGVVEVSGDDREDDCWCDVSVPVDRVCELDLLSVSDFELDGLQTLSVSRSVTPVLH